MITKALSIRAPWWWFILHGGKDIENRDWPTNFRGTVYMHASKWWSLAQIVSDACDILQRMKKVEGDRWVDRVFAKLEITRLRLSAGSIVGTVDIVDCVRESKSPWFFGDYGFVLANPVAFAKPVPCKGALGFFAVPDDVLTQLERAA